MSRENVLALLLQKQGEYLSGEGMSQALGVSRAAVWKAIEVLRQEGYEISSAPRRGYRLEGGPDRIRPGELKGALEGCELGKHLLCLEQIDSTNTEAKRQAVEGAPHGLVVVSEEQTAGRGRLGREFQSPKGCGLYLTALLRPMLPPTEVSDFTAWVAVAVCNAIEACCGVRPGIKWTNDLVLEGKKLCGILTELGLESETQALDYLITGIGINVNHAPEDFSEEVQPIATSLKQVLGKPVSRTELVKCVVRSLDEMYRAFPSAKSKYLAQYRADCITVGKQVQVITPADRREARALEIDDEFRLVVEYADGNRQALSAGEVSVRGLYGYV